MGLDQAYWKLQPPGGRLFADPQPDADETAFQIDNTSAAYYDSVYYKLHRDDLQPVPAPNVAQPRIDLTDILGEEFLAPTVAARKLSFHAVGDTGAAKVNAHQTAAEAIANEASVADAMAWDVRTGGLDAPSFFFHLGDVVYNFGEGQYYYDQFYEPFRGYDRPIFAIPGNHDGVVFGDDPDTPQAPTLTAFLRNFCADTAAQSADAGGLVRSTMTQPGVYFTLDAPFVSIVGLYTNVLEGPGVISSQGGHYPVLNGDAQLEFLKAELKRLAPARKAGERAVIIACTIRQPPSTPNTAAAAGSPTTSTPPPEKQASGPTRSSPDTHTSTSATPAKSTAAKSPTSSLAAAATPQHHRKAASQTHHSRSANTPSSTNPSLNSATSPSPSTCPNPPATSPSPSTTAPTPAPTTPSNSTSRKERFSGRDNRKQTGGGPTADFVTVAGGRYGRLLTVVGP